jgi:hypothetical protein
MFNSLAECSEYIETSYKQTLIPMNVNPLGSRGTKEKFVKEVPQYLFRGESGAFPTTLPSIDRLARDFDFPARALEDILRVRLEVGRSLMEKAALPAMLAKGYAQHYGLPTELLDVTCDLRVAEAFACDLQVGEIGVIGVFPMDVIAQSCTIIDLCSSPTGARPLRQSAFAISHQRYRDYKNFECVEELQIKWLYFKLSKEDQSRFAPDSHILDASTDSMAGLIQLCLNFYGKMSDDAAKWLAKHVPPAPMVGKAKDDEEWSKKLEAKSRATTTSPFIEGPRELIMISSKEAGIEFDEERERLKNYRRWSDKYHEHLISLFGEEDKF